MHFILGWQLQSANLCYMYYHMPRQWKVQLTLLLMGKYFGLLGKYHLCYFPGSSNHQSIRRHGIVWCVGVEWSNMYCSSRVNFISLRRIKYMYQEMIPSVNTFYNIQSTDNPTSKLLLFQGLNMLKTLQLYLISVLIKFKIIITLLL